MPLSFSVPPSVSVRVCVSLPVHYTYADVVLLQLVIAPLPVLTTVRWTEKN